MQGVMKVWVIMAALLLVSSAYAQSARSYFDELYKAGGLDHMADEFDCSMTEMNGPRMSWASV